MKQRSSQHLAIPWAIDESERLTHDFIAVPGSVRYRSNREYLFVSPRSGFGMFPSGWYVSRLSRTGSSDWRYPGHYPTAV